MLILNFFNVIRSIARFSLLETDIKALKKAARQTIGPELEKRIKTIIACL